MIPREQFDAYNKSVANLTSGSSRQVEAAILAWHNKNPEASVAEGRDAAIEIMSGFMQDFDDAAASLAAKWYDMQAERAHFKLPSAVTVTSYSRESVEEVARYQAGKLIDNDWPGFARMCGEAAANDARLSLNKTILANAKRDRKRGVRYARVTTGAETCPFCYMLSSRGAVYYSRKTAGALDRWHNNCDCKVVMGYEDDPDAELVQYYDPKGMRDRMKEMERQTGLSFNNQDDNRTLRSFMELHDPDWLMYGKKVEADYSLNPFKNYGDPKERGVYDYDNFRDHNGEWRDVFAHDSLASAGIKVETRPASAPEGYSNIDLFINGDLWEVKSPHDEKGYVPGSVRFVEKNLRVANRQFKNQWDEKTNARLDYKGPKRVVFNSRYKSVSDEAIAREIPRQMAMHGIDELLFVKKDGNVAYIKKGVDPVSVQTLSPLR